jgi:uncharacterized protein
MKYLLVLLVVLLGAWMLVGRRRGADKPPVQGRDSARSAVPPVTTMVTCAHCGVHLPSAEAVADAEGRLFCGEAHRALGAR